MGSFPALRLDPVPLLSHEDGGQELLAIFLGQLGGVNDSFKETNGSLSLFS